MTAAGIPTGQIHPVLAIGVSHDRNIIGSSPVYKGNPVHPAASTLGLKEGCLIRVCGGSSVTSDIQAVQGDPPKPLQKRICKIGAQSFQGASGTTCKNESI